MVCLNGIGIITFLKTLYWYVPKKNQTKSLFSVTSFKFSIRDVIETAFRWYYEVCLFFFCKNITSLAMILRRKNWATINLKNIRLWMLYVVRSTPHTCHNIHNIKHTTCILYIDKYYTFVMRNIHISVYGYISCNCG